MQVVCHLQRLGQLVPGHLGLVAFPCRTGRLQSDSSSSGSRSWDGSIIWRPAATASATLLASRCVATSGQRPIHLYCVVNALPILHNSAASLVSVTLPRGAHLAMPARRGRPCAGYEPGRSGGLGRSHGCGARERTGLHVVATKAVHGQEEQTLRSQEDLPDPFRHGQ